MESLEHDLLPRDTMAAETFGVRLHSFDAAVERALRELETHTGGARAVSDDAVTADITIDAPPEEVWKVVMDARAVG